MGRRRKTRKRILLKPPKKLPKVFTCPNCGSTTVNVKQDKKAGKVKVACGNCGLEATFDMVPGLLPVDYYNKFVDLYYQGQIAPKKEEIITLSELQTVAGGAEAEEAATTTVEETGEVETTPLEEVSSVEETGTETRESEVSAEAETVEAEESGEESSKE